MRIAIVILDTEAADDEVCVFLYMRCMGNLKVYLLQE